MAVVYSLSGQCEKHYSSGTKEITFPDNTLKYVHPSGEEETNFPDGTVQKVLPDGNMTLFYANGQREIYTKEFKVCSLIHDLVTMGYNILVVDFIMYCKGTFTLKYM